MTLPGTLTLISFLCFFVLRMASEITYGEIMEAVNNKVPPEEQWPRFTNFFIMKSSGWNLFRIYRNLYPNGKLLHRYWICNALGVVAFVLSLACAVWTIRR